MQAITLVKLGGSVITDKTKPYTLQEKNIRQLAKELALYKKPLIISHGAGSFAHTSAKKYGGMKGYVSQQGLAEVAKDAMKLNSLVMDILLEANIPALSFRPMSFLQADRGKLQSDFLAPITEAVRQGFVPVVYGDVIMDNSWQTTIFSGEKILSILASYLQKTYKISTIVEVGITDGVYDDKGKTIPKITPATWEKIQHHTGQSSATDVTGGMQHKVSEAILLAKSNISTAIINGQTPGELTKALAHLPMKGTIISHA